MKGTNTLIINKEQMVDILSEWWAGATYAHKTEDTIVNVTANDMDGFVITLDGAIKDSSEKVK